jgi:hypothetical protein
VRRTDHSSRGVLPSVVCLNECDHGAPKMRGPKSTVALLSHKQTKNKQTNKLTRSDTSQNLYFEGWLLFADKFCQVFCF